MNRNIAWKIAGKSNSKLTPMMKRLDVKTQIMLTLPVLAFLFFIFIWSRVANSSSKFRVVEHEIAYEIEPSLIMGNVPDKSLPRGFSHRITINYPYPLLANLRRMQISKLHKLSAKMYCTDEKGRLMPSRQHFEWNEFGQVTSQTQYSSRISSTVRRSLIFHVQLQWNDGSKPIDLPVTTISPADLQTNEGFSLDLNSQ